MTRTAFLLVLAALAVPGCYHWDETYRYDDAYASRQQSIWENEDQVVRFPEREPADPARPAPAEAQEIEEEVVDLRQPPDAEPVDPAGPPLPADSADEPPGLIFQVQLRLSGVEDGGVDAVVRGVSGLASVERVHVLAHGPDGLLLGLLLKTTLDAFIEDIQKAQDLPVDFLGTTTLIQGRLRKASPAGVSIFAPRDGAVLSASEVWVGVAVQGADGPVRVTVNGTPAAPLDGGRYKAKVACRPGENRLTAVAELADGTRRSASVTVTVREPGPPPGKGRTVLVQGKIDDPRGSVLVDGRSVPVDEKGRYRTEVEVPEGTRFLTVIETDSLGNRTIRRISVE